MKYISDLNLLSSKGLPQTNDNTIKIVLTDVFILLGAIALLMIVIAGLRYILARGNADATAQAKSMLSHSLVGLIIAALAATIVNFVLGRVG